MPDICWFQLLKCFIRLSVFLVENQWIVFKLSGRTDIIDWYAVSADDHFQYFNSNSLLVAGFVWRRGLSEGFGASHTCSISHKSYFPPKMLCCWRRGSADQLSSRFLASSFFPFSLLVPNSHLILLLFLHHPLLFFLFSSSNTTQQLSSVWK